MFSAKDTAKARPGERAIEWLQLSDRDDPQGVAAGTHRERSADHFYRSFPGAVQNVLQYCRGSAADGVAIMGAKRL